MAPRLFASGGKTFFLPISFTACSSNFSGGNNIIFPHSLISVGASCPHCTTVAPPMCGTLIRFPGSWNLIEHRPPILGSNGFEGPAWTWGGGRYVKGPRYLTYLWGRGGELGVLRVREHPLVAKSTLSKLKKNFTKHFVITKIQQKYDYLSSNQGNSMINTSKISR